MNKLKQNLTICALFLLLIVVAASPLFLIEFNNEQIINKINIMSMQTESMELEESPSVDYNTEERIQIIKNVKSSKTGVITEQQVSSMSDDKKRKLLHSMEEQFDILFNLGALPKIEFPESNYVLISKTTYNDTINPNESVSIWSIDVEYPDFYVSVQMDTETSILYDVTISSTLKLEFDPDHISIMTFLNYLQIKPQHLNWNGIEYGSSGFFLNNDVPIFYYEKSKYYIKYTVTM